VLLPQDDHPSIVIIIFFIDRLLCKNADNKSDIKIRI
jgi:hypothetical protein